MIALFNRKKQQTCLPTASICVRVEQVPGSPICCFYSQRISVIISVELRKRTHFKFNDSCMEWKKYSQVCLLTVHWTGHTKSKYTITYTIHNKISSRNWSNPLSYAFFNDSSKITTSPHPIINSNYFICSAFYTGSSLASPAFSLLMTFFSFSCLTFLANSPIYIKKNS